MYYAASGPVHCEMAGSTVIRIEIQNKSFGNHRALRDLRIDFGSGEFVGLIGPSGCGKSTLLNILGQLDQDYQGSVDFTKNHIDVSIGYVFQTPRLMPWLTIRQNVSLVTNGNHSEILTKEILQQVGLETWQDHYPHQLSGGMQRRAALARAFVINPDLLLLDEPFVSLDNPSTNQLRELLLRLWRTYRPTVVLVTHELREALVLANRVLFLSGAPGTLLLDYDIGLARPRESLDPAMVDLETDILAKYPNILSGSLSC